METGTTRKSADGSMEQPSGIARVIPAQPSGAASTGLIPKHSPYPHFSSLVSLRFFAAASVVLAHTLFPLLRRGDYAGWAFPSLMVFFHVLSGFTLAYVYPTLENRMKILRFWVARVGRIWPVHIGVIVVVIVCFWKQQAFSGLWWEKLASSVTLTQSWFTCGNFNLAVNPPSWSLSTEFGLYLLFPVLIRNWERTWHIKLIGAYCLALATCCFCDYCMYHPGSLLTGVEAWTLVYIHPFIRLPEFVIGMSLALLWDRIHGRFKMSIAMGTIMEVGALAACVALMLTTNSAATALDNHFHIGSVWVAWFKKILFPLVPFALLIFAFSLNRGSISALLGLPIFVFLGELSFSIYLIHMPLIDAFIPAASHQSSHLHMYAVFAAFWCCVLSVSYVVYRFWEQPWRRFFRRLLPEPAPSAGVPPQQREPRKAVLPASSVS